ncbi:tape measure protein [Muricomes intestini]|jgi:tape measure domain-containing protein|uniref:tape measure protein n=1 Tax=Muricomes intestini TaxID=1796634 RepID=UPI002FDD713E
MESCSVNAVLSATDRGFTSAMNKAQGSLQGVEKSSGKMNKSIMEIAKGVGVFKALSVVTDSLSNALDGAIKRYDTMNRFPAVMKQMGFETKQSEQAVNRLSEGIDGLPTTLDGVVSTTQRLASTTGNLDKSVDTTLALNNALIASGATTDQTARATDQYVKILSTGKVEAESWQTLSETMSFALKEVAGSFGFAGDSATNDLYSALKNGDITVKDFNSRMIELSNQTGGFAEIAQTSAGGIETSFQNMQTAVVRGVEGMIRSIDEGLTENSLPNLQGVLDITKGYINDFFGAASTGAKELIGFVAPAIKAVAGNMDIIGPAAASATAGFVAFRAATSLTEHFRNLKESIKDTSKVLDEIKDSNAKWTVSSQEAQKAVEKQAAATEAVEKAYEANEKSIVAAVQASQLDEAAKKASEKATKAQAKAELLSKEAVDKKKAASSAATNQEKLNSAAKEASEDASKAQARAELLSAEATKKQEVAKKAGVSATKAKTEADIASTAAEEAQSAASAASVVQLSLKQAVMGVLRGQISATTVAQQALNAAWKANPLGLIITGVTALVTVYKTLSKWAIKNNDELQETKAQAEKTSAAVDDLVDSIESSADAHDANIRNIEAEASASETLAKKITDLAGKEELSKSEKAELDAMINQLNGSVEGLNLAYDEQTGTLNMTDEAIQAVTNSYKEQAEAQALQERGVELLKEQMAATDELKAVEKQRKEVGDQLNETTTTLFGSGKELKKTDEELAEKEDALRQKQEELTVAIDDNAARVEENAKTRVEAEAKVSEAVNNGTQEQIIAYDMLNDEQKSAVDGMNEAWQSYVDHATDMFDTLSDKSETSVAEMTANLQENQRVISEWSDNIAVLAERGVDEGLLQQLRDAGPESAGYVKEMVNASDSELQGLSDAFSTGAQTATDAMKSVYDMSDMQDSVRGMVFKQKDSIQEAIATADFQSIGKAVPDGYTQGIDENSDQAANAAGEMVKGGIESAQLAQDSHSPSVVYEGLGKDAVAGYIQGVQGTQGQIATAMRTAIQSGMQAAELATTTSMSNIAKSTSTAFTGMNSAAKSGMSQMSSTVTSGMKKNENSVKTSMNSSARETTSGMNKMRSATTSGMSQLVNAITSGMNRSVSSVTNGKNRMVAQVNTLSSSFYTAGVNASQGLANGVNAGAGAAIAAARNVADQVAATMRKALDERSPSKVTAKIGAYATEGLAVGQLDALPLVKKASKKVADMMVPGAISNSAFRAGNYAMEANYNVVGDFPNNENNFDYDRFGKVVKEAIKELRITMVNNMDSRAVGYGTAKFVEEKNAFDATRKNRIGGVVNV